MSTPAAILALTIHLATPCGIDDAFLGMSQEKFEAAYPDSRRIMKDDGEGENHLLIEVFDKNGNYLFEAQIENGKIYNISSSSALIKTKENIGPGSSLESANDVYKNGKMLHGEGIFFMTYKKIPWASFELSDEGNRVNSISIIQSVDESGKYYCNLLNPKLSSSLK